MRTTTSEAAAASTAAVEEHVGPRARTVFGLERWAVLPAVAIAAIVALFGLGIPWLDSVVSDQPAGTEPIPAGMGVTVTPPAPGWELDDDATSAKASGPGAVVITHRGVRMGVSTGSYDGDARSLLDRIDDDVVHLSRSLEVGSTTEVTTAGGVTGVHRTFHDGERLVLQYTFVQDGVGVTASAGGTPSAVAAQRSAISTFVGSISFPEASS